MKTFSLALVSFLVLVGCGGEGPETAVKADPVPSPSASTSATTCPPPARVEIYFVTAEAVDVPAGTIGESKPACNPGDTVIGGDCGISTSGKLHMATGLRPTDNTPQVWLCLGSAGDVSASIDAKAICAKNVVTVGR
jgi:hypothetical protein